ncbi:glycosyltransferase family 2 protein [Zunongwangia sp. HRR-M8]|uniref:glycosyltransferase family 2 protein n=1 Tax=Zunongwangia sp. HRR-M8 TaxID=3015170 RepID=UPI0022DD6DD3|nr:glycosyltransferase family 2 protein [Zunongwangia sp. HRR-M8]WBL23283.1 glycosyltransferase family 2 protein [Zunongwangia sp. HRR-M8]
MKVAVVILNWNGKDLLKQFLPSVTQFSTEANIYVADNASTDDSIEFLRNNFPEVKIIQNKENGGYAKGYNDALKHLSEEILILLNSDIEVTINWLQPILEMFGKESKTAVVQPKILDYKKKDHFEYAGAAGGFIDKFGYPFCRGRIFDTIEKDFGQFNDNAEIFWASGACLAIRNEVFKEIGGFDEDFFAHQEEIDLCWRIKNFDYDIKYTGNSVVYHVGGATLDKINPKKTYYNFRNSLFMLVKNLPKKEMRKIVFQRMILDGIAGLKFLIQGDYKHLISVLKAHTHFYANFSKMSRKRIEKSSNIQYFEIKSVVFKYFVLRKKTFKNIM